VDYLKTENRILRARLPKKIDTTAAERAKLLKAGKPLGSKIKDLVTIVTPRTAWFSWAFFQIRAPHCVVVSKLPHGGAARQFEAAYSSTVSAFVPSNHRAPRG